MIDTFGIIWQIFEPLKSKMLDSLDKSRDKTQDPVADFELHAGRQDSRAKAIITILGLVAGSWFTAVTSYRLGRADGKDEAEKDQSKEYLEAQARIDGITGQKNLTAAKLDLETKWSPLFIEKLKTATVRVTMLDGKGGLRSATGFVYAPNILVTSKHALGDLEGVSGKFLADRRLESLEILKWPGKLPIRIFNSEEDTSAPIAVVHENLDIGILVFPSQVFKGIRPLTAARDNASEKTAVATCTTAPEDPGTVKAGFYDGRDFSSSDMRIFADNIVGGNSGSPIININGNVCGIIKAVDPAKYGQKDIPSLAFAVPVNEETIETMVKEAQTLYPQLFLRSGWTKEKRIGRRSLEFELPKRPKKKNPHPARNRIIR